MRTMAGVLSLGGFLLMASGGAGIAQGWPPWAEELFGPSPGYQPRRETPGPLLEQELPDWTDDVREGGARPAIAPEAPLVVSFAYQFPANSIVIDTGARKLYYVLADKTAYAYAIGVGREGFGWAGTETVSRKQDWPDWHPPAEMRERDPRLPKRMTGGIQNPLGAVALYLGNTLYRIHGTNDPKSIGRAESSGCFRMPNSAALHLASITGVGTPVTVLGSLADRQQLSRVPEVARDPARSDRARQSAPAAAGDGTRVR
jgi:lipoprotein-anchoring transpeptidase ErfK/SrfK